jgi:hypothetical protein
MFFPLIFEGKKKFKLTQKIFNIFNKILQEKKTNKKENFSFERLNPREANKKI